MKKYLLFLALALLLVPVAMAIEDYTVGQKIDIVITLFNNTGSSLDPINIQACTGSVYYYGNTSWIIQNTQLDNNTGGIHNFSFTPSYGGEYGVLIECWVSGELATYSRKIEVMGQGLIDKIDDIQSNITDISQDINNITNSMDQVLSYLDEINTTTHNAYTYLTATLDLKIDNINSTSQEILGRWGTLSADDIYRMFNQSVISEGEEIIQNGMFDNTSVWNLTDGNWTITDGALAINNIDNENRSASQELGASLVAGHTYNISWSIPIATAGTLNIYIGSDLVDSITEAGNYSLNVTYLSGDTTFYLNSNADGFVGTVDNVSVKEIIVTYNNTINAEFDALSSLLALIKDDSESILNRWGTAYAEEILNLANLTYTNMANISYISSMNESIYNNFNSSIENTQEILDRIGLPTDDLTYDTLYGEFRYTQNRIDYIIDEISGLETSLSQTLAALAELKDMHNCNFDPETEICTLLESIENYAISIDSMVQNINETTTETNTIVQQINDTISSDFSVRTSNFGKIAAGKEFMMKVWVTDYLGRPRNADNAPTMILYDPLNDDIVSGVAMTQIGTGVYFYNFTTSSAYTDGVWEALATVTVEGITNTYNDYWELVSSPAEVRINSIIDSTIPTITADVTITNEGSAAQEYQYEYCVVDEAKAPCGGEHDLSYQSGAKLLNPAQTWNPLLTLNNINKQGTLWFKIVVSYGAEKSGASKSFNAVIASNNTGGNSNTGTNTGGGGSSTVWTTTTTVASSSTTTNTVPWQQKPQENVIIIEQRAPENNYVPKESEEKNARMQIKEYDSHITLVPGTKTEKSITIKNNGDVTLHNLELLISGMQFDSYDVSPKVTDLKIEEEQIFKITFNIDEEINPSLVRIIARSEEISKEIPVLIDSESEKTPLIDLPLTEKKRIRFDWLFSMIKWIVITVIVFGVIYLGSIGTIKIVRNFNSYDRPKGNRTIKTTEKKDIFATEKKSKNVFLWKMPEKNSTKPTLSKEPVKPDIKPHELKTNFEPKKEQTIHHDVARLEQHGFRIRKDMLPQAKEPAKPPISAREEMKLYQERLLHQDIARLEQHGFRIRKENYNLGKVEQEPVKNIQQKEEQVQVKVAEVKPVVKSEKELEKEMLSRMSKNSIKEVESETAKILQYGFRTEIQRDIPKELDPPRPKNYKPQLISRSKDNVASLKDYYSSKESIVPKENISVPEKEIVKEQKVTEEIQKREEVSDQRRDMISRLKEIYK